MQRDREARRRENQVAFAIENSDLQRKIRVKRAANLILFVVDASWSMAVAERMSATKGAIMSLLTDAYQRRDRVGLIVFQKNKSTLVLPPTSHVAITVHTDEAAILSVDGQLHHDLADGDTVRLSAGPHRLRLLRQGPASQFYGTLVDRLGRW